MKQERKAPHKKLIFRWTFAACLAIFLFWTTYYFLAGQVPTIRNLEIAPGLSYNLPFAMFRWWDVLIGFIWPAIIILALKMSKNDDFVSGVGAGLIAAPLPGLTVGLLAVLVIGPGIVLAVGLTIELIIIELVGLFAGLSGNLKDGLIAGLSAGLGAVLSLSLVVGLVFGFVAGLGFFMGSFLFLGFVTGLVFLVLLVLQLTKYSPRFLVSFWDWLTANKAD